MRRTLIHILIAGTAMATNASGLPAPTLNTQFMETSPLADGKWVQISIDETGLYEISYDRLRQMGFSDPSKVALFGTGGYQLDFNFAENDGYPLYSDTFEPVAVLHTGSKMIFYGAGTETMSAAPVGYANKRMRHRRMSKNIYSDRSYYLLTDSSTPEAPDQNPIANKQGFVDAPYGYGYIYHERDLRHNEYTEGQVFWGEEVFIGSPRTFTIEAPYCVDQSAHVWLEYANMHETGGVVECTLNGFKTTSQIANMPCNIYNLGTSSEQVRLNIDSNNIGRGTLTFSVSGDYPAGVPLAIDYWTVSYPISLELAKNDPQFACQYISFTDKSLGKWRHPVPDNTIVWDITSRRKPKKLDIENGYFYNNVKYATQLVAFNPDRQQRQINPDWKALPNQDLHSWQNEPVAMVIITTPAFRSYAQNLADLHETHLGEKVVVITPQEVYDEFNYGTPDLTALRAFIKMIYQKQSATLKNVLLFGTISSDYRNVEGHPDRPEQLPVYMVPKINLKKAESSEGAAALDYLGVMGDFINYNGILSNSSVELGVGLLPIGTSEEAALAVQKVNGYLTREDFSNLVNEFLTLSDTGDSHIHDFQAFRLANLYKDYAADLFNSEYAVSPLWTEAIGFDKVSEELLTSLRRGKLLTTYYGHAGAGGFLSNTYQDFVSLDNKEPAFFFMAACDLCEPDRSHHGIGDLGVIRNSHGLNGVICATRSVLSHENQTLSENFINSLFFDRDNAVRTKTPNIGEAYARAKSLTGNVSKQAFIYVGDPGLPFPVALGKVQLSTDRTNYRGGEVMEVTGQLLDASGEPDNSYNGYATVKLMEPTSTTAIVNDPVDENGVVRPNPRLSINDYRLATVKAEVRDGRFTARMQLPKRVDNFLSTPDSTRTLKVLAGTYDPSTRLGASGRLAIAMPMRGSTPAADAIKDTKAPQVSATHDEVMRRLTVTASDDTGLLPGIGKGSAVTMTIDGNACVAPAEESMDMTVTGFSVPVSTAHLAIGKHTAELTATDVAGNTSAKVKVNFEIKEIAPLKLSTPSDIVISELTLKLNSQPDAELTLDICDEKGAVVYSDTMTSRSLTLDLGHLPQGLYKAAVREDSPRGSKIFSNWLNFTKID